MRPPVPSAIRFSFLLSVCLLVAAGCHRVEARAPRNVLLVSIDTLRADHVGAYGAEHAKTPTLDRLAARGVRFDAAFSPAPLTLPSHATMLTGTEPYRHGVRHNGIHRLDASRATLAERFAEAGFATAAAVGSLVIGSQSGLERGFGLYDDAIATQGDHATGQRRAEDVNAAAIRWLDETHEPFFLFVHYYDPHRPHASPTPYSSAAASPYEGEISYTDAMLGELLSHLDRKSMLDDTLILVTSDHGEGLGEHDELTHGHAIYDATQRVPLLIQGPGVAQGRVVHEIVGTADIAPTLLALLDLAPLESVDGADLTRTWRGDPEIDRDRAEAHPSGPPERLAYLESQATRYDHGWSPLHGLRSRTHLYIRAPHSELYAVATDPAQRRNLLDSPDEAAHVEAARLDRILGERLAEDHTAPRQELDEATLAQLHALGYAIAAEPVEDNGIDPKLGRKGLALFHEGDALYQAGRPREAAERFEQMLEISPESGEAWISLGAAWLNAGELERAHHATRNGAEKMPERGSVWLQLGVIELARDRLEEAEACFRHAIERSPEAPGGYLRLMKALLMRGELEAAREAEAALLRRVREDEIGLRRIADFWEAEGQTDLALAAYQRVLEQAPGSERDHLHAAIALIRLGRPEEARDHIARSGNVPAQPRAREALVAAYREAGLAARAP